MDKLKIADAEFTSRLLIGTGKYSSNKIMAEAIAAAGTEIVTVALRRVDIDNENDDLLGAIDRDKYMLLPNTSGARDNEEAVRLAKLARGASGINWVKLEVTPDPYYLLPDGSETLKAAEVLVKDGFVVLPYINADPILAKKLQDVGTATVMPLASPIGSNRGLKTKDAIEIIISQAVVPVVVDAGLGAPSDAAEAMEMGADAVLVNTAIATADDPVKMAEAFKLATKAGRTAYLSGLAAQAKRASASSPLTGFLRNEKQENA
jgi:thiazole synthase